MTPRRILWSIWGRGRRMWFPRRIRRLWWAIRMQANESVCSIEIKNEHVGFFAQMTWCLYIFQHCERHALIPDIRLTSNMYLDPKRGPNWLDYYFTSNERGSSGEKTRRICYTKTINEWEDMGQPFGADLSVDDGSRLLHKYLSLQPYITQIVEDFWKELPSGPVLGIHFRGTDKASEAPRVSWAHCLDVLNAQLRSYPDIRAVFVASDELGFVDFIVKSIKGPVFWRDDYYRSVDERAVHTAAGEAGGYEKGEDALVNAILLSKCSVLVRTTSFLSAWASIFNPILKVILLNKPYSGNVWYPESEIVSKSDTDYVPEVHV